ARFARRYADKLILEAGDERVRSDQHRDILAGAALERLAVDAAGKSDGDAVVLGRLFAVCFRSVRPVLLGDGGDAFVDLGVGHLGGETGELDVLEVGELDGRHNLDRHRVGQIGLARDQFLDRALLGRQRDFRLGRKAVAALADDLIVGVAHGCFDHLGHRRAAIDALEVLNRHLAGAETVDADAVLKLVEPHIDLGVKLGCRDDDLVFALEAVGQSFSYLHEHTSLPVLDYVSMPRAWCGRRDSNPHDFRHGNLNPARLPVPPRPQRAAKRRRNLAGLYAATLPDARRG